jgi:hypothetical protein|tara:strand:- start:25 stop:222 length:198 start_codon:yes stop_codon:yes gene_type:complete
MSFSDSFGASKDINIGTVSPPESFPSPSVSACANRARYLSWSAADIGGHGASFAAAADIMPGARS